MVSKFRCKSCGQTVAVEQADKVTTYSDGICSACLAREEVRTIIASLCSKGMRGCDYDCKSCQDLTEVLQGMSKEGVVLAAVRDTPTLSGDGIFRETIYTTLIVEKRL